MKTRISKRILSLLLTLCLLLCSFAPSVLTVNAATAVKVEYMGDYVCADFSNSRLFALKGTKLYLSVIKYIPCIRTAKKATSIFLIHLL